MSSVNIADKNKRLRGYKYRAYPTRSQQQWLAKCFGCVRFVYNWFLRWRKDIYATAKESVTYGMCCARLTLLKDEYPWLREVDSIALQQSLRHLDRAYDNFFKKRSGYPKFKKKLSEQRYRTMNIGGSSIAIDGDRIRLPKLGWIKISNSRDFDGRIVSATVTKKPSGRYFITLQVEEDIELLPNNGGTVGIDLGLKSFYADSNGSSVEAPKPLRKHERRLKRLQRQLSRKQKGSKNRGKARAKLAREYEKVSNIREDFLNKEAFRLANDNQVVCMEDLNVRGMMKNHHLAKSIADASWSMFSSKLEWQIEKHGGILIKVPRFYASSQTCSCCGAKNPEVRDLRVREWTCPECGAVLDRDDNAAVNIEAEGLKQLNTA